MDADCLVGEHLHDLPVHSLAVVREFHHLPFVVLPLCRDPCQNCYLFHNYKTATMFSHLNDLHAAFSTSK